MSADPRPVNLLLEENLSPWAAAQLRDAGFEAVHVRDRGLLGASDTEVLRQDRLLVTSTVGDFVTIRKAAAVDAGVVLFEEVGLRRAEQLERLATEVELLADLPDMRLATAALHPEANQ